MRRFVSYLQHDSMDCGSTCLRMVAKYYGKEIDSETLRQRCHVTGEGVSLLGISDVAESIGFRTMGVRICWEQLYDDMPMPCIVHWNQNHFVVVRRIITRMGKHIVKIADPAYGFLEYDRDAFMDCWTGGGRNTLGIALALEPTQEFFSEKESKNKGLDFKFILSHLRPFRGRIVQILATMLCVSLINLALPLVTQAVVDKGIGSKNIELVTVFLLAQLLLALGCMASNCVRDWLSLHTASRISISLLSDFLRKLVNLPMAFFDGRTIGDIMQRATDYNRVQNFLTESFLSMLVAVASLIVYSSIMVGYNKRVFIIFVAGTVLYIAWVAVFMKRRRKLDYMRFRQASDSQDAMVQLVDGIRDIRLNDCEKHMCWNLENIQTGLYDINIKALGLRQAQEFGSTFIDQVKNIMVSFIAAKSVIDGSMTLGMMMAIQYIIGQLNAPVSHFIAFVQTYQDASISLDRVGEIQRMNDEEPEDEPHIGEIPANADIRFEGVSFQYAGLHSEKVLDDVSFVLPTGKVTAVVGASGSGKSTILKMILGFYAPTEGEIFLAGVPLEQYSKKAWRRRCGVVMQEGILFSGSIAENVSLFDECMDMKRIREATDIACISEWIESLPLGYNTRIGLNGHKLSGGQKQRLLIARAVYRKTDYLLLDEATNSLDTYNERTITENLVRLFPGKTVVIIAHRLSTIRGADNIIVLEKGRIAETGTHDVLIENKGVYYKLVKNQLGFES